MSAALRLMLALSVLGLAACGDGHETAPCAALPGGGYCLRAATAVAPFTAVQDVAIRRGNAALAHGATTLSAQAAA